MTACTRAVQDASGGSVQCDLVLGPDDVLVHVDGTVECDLVLGPDDVLVHEVCVVFPFLHRAPTN